MWLVNHGFLGTAVLPPGFPVFFSDDLINPRVINDNVGYINILIVVFGFSPFYAQ